MTTFRISDGDGHKRSPLGNHRQHDPAGEEVLTQVQAAQHGWVSSNVAPFAVAGSNQTVAGWNEDGTATVTLDGSGSSDPEGQLVSWDWTWPGGSASGETVQVDFPVGTRTITLTVTDHEGATGADQLTVTVTTPTWNPIFGSDTLCCFDLTDGSYNNYRSGNIIESIDSNEGRGTQLVSSHGSWPRFDDTHDGTFMYEGAGVDVRFPGPGSVGRTASDPVTYLAIVRVDADTSGYLFDSPGATNDRTLAVLVGADLEARIHGGLLNPSFSVGADSYIAVAMTGGGAENRKIYYRVLGPGGTTAVLDGGGPIGTTVPSELFFMARQNPGAYPFNGGAALALAVYTEIKSQAEIDSVFDHFQDIHAGGTELVPPMTSNTAPAPYVASADNDGFGAAYQAFDNNPNTAWTTTYEFIDHWLQIDLGSAQSVSAYELVNRVNAVPGSPRSWFLQSSTNGSTWTTRHTVTGNMNNASGASKGVFSITPVSARYWRIYVDEVHEFNPPGQVFTAIAAFKLLS